MLKTTQAASGSGASEPAARRRLLKLILVPLLALAAVACAQPSRTAPPQAAPPAVQPLALPPLAQAAPPVQEAQPAHPPVVICLDPGHPSDVSSGKTLINGATEMEMNWQVTQRLAAHLAKNPTYKVVKTRNVKDQVMPNRDRAEVANRAGAALTVRLHCDYGKGSGFALYYPDQQGKKDGFVGPTDQVIVSSRQLAQALHAAMARRLAGQLRDNGIKGDSVTAVGRKQGALTGSIFSQVPTVTIEMVFLNNKADAAFIKSPQGQEQMALALAEGIALYLKSAPQARGRAK